MRKLAIQLATLSPCALAGNAGDIVCACFKRNEAATTVAVHCSLYRFICAGHTYPALAAKYTFGLICVKQQKALTEILFIRCHSEIIPFIRKWTFHKCSPEEVHRITPTHH